MLVGHERTVLTVGEGQDQREPGCGAAECGHACHSGPVDLC